MSLPSGSLDLRLFTRPVTSLLEKYGNDPLPLTQRPGACGDEANGIKNTPAQVLFPEGRDAGGAVSGLLLLLGCWDKAHEVAQDIPSREGSYWHAFLHRMEPDSWNSSYWFRKVGPHPIFSDLHAAATAVLESAPKTGWKLKASWDPSLFIEWCEEARKASGTVKEQIAMRIQHAEWRLLFNWCASKDA